MNFQKFKSLDSGGNFRQVPKANSHGLPVIAFSFLTWLFPIVSQAQDIAFTIPEKDLFPEGIAFDSTDNAIYVSSILKNKIVVKVGNNIADFIETDQYGFMGGVGLHVDTKRRILWACSGNIMGERYRTGLFAFGLPSGTLLKKIVYPESTTPSFFNDLVIAGDGSVFITNTADHSIWKFSMDMEEPVKLKLSEPIEYPNGIVMPDRQGLIMATDKGLQRVDLATGQVQLLAVPSGGETAQGLDGIVVYKNSIIGVQNGFRSNKDMRIVRYFLSSDHRAIERTERIDIGNSKFDIPTTLAVGKGYLYVLANSQLGNLDQEHLKIISKEKLNETFILKYKLP